MCPQIGTEVLKTVRGRVEPVPAGRARISKSRNALKHDLRKISSVRVTVQEKGVGVSKASLSSLDPCRAAVPCWG